MSAQNLLRRIPRSALLASVAVSAWCALPAQAAATIYPGAMCTSDGPVERRLNGELWNKSTNIATYTMFHCPVVLTENFANGGTVTATVFVRWNDNELTPAKFECALRTTTVFGQIADYKDLGILPKANSGTFTSGTGSVTVPAATGLPSSVHLRCRVPNGSDPVNGGANGSSGWGWAGIVAYRISH